MLGMRSAPPGFLEARYENTESRYITVDGTKIHYRVEGNSKGPTLILLHGVLASLHTWDGWVERLSSKYRIVRLDLPGFGLSGPLANKEYTPEYAVEFFEMTRKEMGIERFHLAGNSLGGFISWFYATKYPEHVDKLILIDPIAYPQPLPRIIKFASGAFGGTMAQISSPRFIVKRNIRQVYGNPDSVNDDLIDRYHDLLLNEGHREAMVEYFRTLKKYSVDDSIAQSIPKIQAPTLLMWGGKDRWVPIELIDRWKHDVKGLKVHVYDEGGHVPMEEFPDATARDAHAFLSDGSVTSTASAGGDDSGQPSWETADTAEADSAEAEAEAAPEPEPAPAAPPPPAKKKPAPKADDGMVGWGDYGAM
jgi:pimeloyl-ACP methyl ester carboxylesterase